MNWETTTFGFTPYGGKPDCDYEHPCFRCGRDLGDEPTRWIRLVAGGARILRPTDYAKWDEQASWDERMGDVGLHPVGSECARKIGTDWIYFTDEPTTTNQPKEENE